MAPRAGPRTVAALLLSAAGLAFACSQSALLGVSERQVPISAASGGTITAGGGDAPALAGFKLVFHPGDLNADTPVTLQLGPSSEDFNSAGPSVLLGPMGLLLNHPADLTLPYSLGPGQSAAELSVELEYGPGQAQHIDHELLTVDTAAHLIDCPLPVLGEVHALAPHHCQQDEDCGGNAFCHETMCRPLYLPDGGLDPEVDGGPHHP